MSSKPAALVLNQYQASLDGRDGTNQRLTSVVTMVVRPVVSSDIDYVLRMDKLAQTNRSRRALVQGAVERSECFVAVDDGILAGYGVMNYGFFGRGFVSLVYADAAQPAPRPERGLLASKRISSALLRPFSIALFSLVKTPS